MSLYWLLICHGMMTLTIAVSFLCGQWPIFQGTPISCIHRFLTFGAYRFFLKFVGAVCGDRGKNVVFSVEYYCCDRANPILQAENVSQYLSAYPYDNMIFTKKECPTCKIPKPARSKHCSLCKRCVARFDHHCGWMNNCIGERNTRYFLAFLIWHFLLCVYGTVAIGLVLAGRGRVEELQIMHILIVYCGVDNSISSLAPYIAQWLLDAHNTQILLMVFLAIVSLLLAGFFVYHANLCLTNTTTNETFKWQDYVIWQKKLNEAQAALNVNTSGMTTEGKPQEIKCKSFFRRFLPQETEVVVRRNVYDKGFFHNIYEVIFPVSTRASFMLTKLKSG